VLHLTRIQPLLANVRFGRKCFSQTNALAYFVSFIAMCFTFASFTRNSKVSSFQWPNVLFFVQFSALRKKLECLSLTCLPIGGQRLSRWNPILVVALGPEAVFQTPHFPHYFFHYCWSLSPACTNTLAYYRICTLQTCNVL
jgi:hypothetical protein